MIIKIQPNREQVEYSRTFLNTGDIAHRGDFDGNYFKQLFGIQAQIIVSDYLGLPRPTNNNQFDGGYDLVWKGKKWDVKCELRNVPFKSNYAHNLNVHQINYPVDGYIFVSYNQEEGTFEICGCIDKKDFLKNSKHFGYEDRRVRDDGSVMKIQGKLGMYELSQKYLIPLKRNINDPFIEDCIKNKIISKKAYLEQK